MLRLILPLCLLAQPALAGEIVTSGSNAALEWRAASAVGGQAHLPGPARPLPGQFPANRAQDGAAGLQISGTIAVGMVFGPTPGFSHGVTPYFDGAFDLVMTQQ